MKEKVVIMNKIITFKIFRICEVGYENSHGQSDDLFIKKKITYKHFQMFLQQILLKNLFNTASLIKIQLILVTIIKGDYLIKILSFS